MGPPPINHVLIETASGITLQGAALVDLHQHLGDGITGIQALVHYEAKARMLLSERPEASSTGDEAILQDAPGEVPSELPS